MSPKPLPPPPERPLPSDCCDSGCAVCVMDLYAIALAEWQAEVARISAVQPLDDEPSESRP